MPTKQEVLDLASKLGNELANFDVVMEHLKAQAAVESDAAAQGLLQQYNSHIAKLREAEEKQLPIEPADKQKLQEFESQLASNDAVREFMRRQADYLALMQEVNQAMGAPLAAAAQNASNA